MIAVIRKHSYLFLAFLVISAILVPILLQRSVNSHYDKVVVEALEKQDPDYTAMIISLNNKTVEQVLDDILNLFDFREFSARRANIFLIFDGYINNSIEAKIIVPYGIDYLDGLNIYTDVYVINLDNKVFLPSNKLINSSISLKCTNKFLNIGRFDLKPVPDNTKRFLEDNILIYSRHKESLAILIYRDVKYNILDCTNVDYVILLEDIYPYIDYPSGKSEPIKESDVISWFSFLRQNLTHRGYYIKYVAPVVYKMILVRYDRLIDLGMQILFLSVLYLLIVLYASLFVYRVLRPVIVKESKLLLSLGLSRSRVHSSMLISLFGLVLISIVLSVYAYNSIYSKYVYIEYLQYAYLLIYPAFACILAIFIWRSLMGKPIKRFNLLFSIILVIGLILGFTRNPIKMLSETLIRLYYWPVEAVVVIMILLPIMYFIIKFLYGRIIGGYAGITPLIMVIGIILSLLILPAGQALAYKEATNRVVDMVFPPDINNITLCNAVLDHPLFSILAQRDNWYFILDGIVYNLGAIKLVQYSHPEASTSIGISSTVSPGVGAPLSVKVMSPMIKVVLANKAVLEELGMLKGLDGGTAILFLPLIGEKKSLTIIRDIISLNGSMINVSIIEDVTDPRTIRNLGYYRLRVLDYYLPLWYLTDIDPRAIPPFAFELYLRKYAVLLIPVDPVRINSPLKNIIEEGITGYLGLINIKYESGNNVIACSTGSINVNYDDLRKRFTEFINVDTSYTSGLFILEAIIVLGLAFASYYNEYRSIYKLNEKLLVSLGLDEVMVREITLVELFLFSGIVVMASVIISYILGFHQSLYYLTLLISLVLLFSALLVYRFKVVRWLRE